MQRAFFPLSVLRLLTGYLLKTLYFLLHLLTALDRFALLSTTGGLVVSGATNPGAGAGALAAGDGTVNVWDAVVGLVGA